MSKRLGIAAALLLLLCPPAAAQPGPNIVLIYADDLGYGDVSAYGARSVSTPNIDRLAQAGLRFTDAHSAAATCTPSRYALLTGEYAFRKPGTGVLPGNAALIIEPGRTTLASLLRSAGYSTGVVGKWHLGLGPAGGPDWNGEIKPSPNDIGFDYSFIMAATGDRVPTVYVENRRVVGLDAADPITVSYAAPVDGSATGKGNPEQLRMAPSHGHDQTIVNGISRIGYMKGGRAALWKDEDMADEFTRRAVRFIEQQKARPFFLFFALHDPHVPRVPHPRFAGKTTMGPRGDVIVETDDAAVFDIDGGHAIAGRGHDERMVEADVVRARPDVAVPVRSTLGPEPEMPLADDPCGIACAAQHRRQRGPARLDDQRRVARQDAGSRLTEGVLAGQQRVTRRRAGSRRRMGIGEAQSALRQTIDVRRTDRPGTIGRHVSVAEIIRVDQNDVRLRRPPRGR